MLQLSDGFARAAPAKRSVREEPVLQDRAEQFLTVIRTPPPPKRQCLPARFWDRIPYHFPTPAPAVQVATGLVGVLFGAWMELKQEGTLLEEHPESGEQGIGSCGSHGRSDLLRRLLGMCAVATCQPDTSSSYVSSHHLLIGCAHTIFLRIAHT